MLKTAIQAEIPLISASTDDKVYVGRLLQSIAGKKAQPLQGSKLTGSVLQNNMVFYTYDAAAATLENYTILKENERSLVILNGQPNDLCLNVGFLHAPDDCLRWIIEQCGLKVANRVPALRGLSIKGAEELLLLTSAHFGDTSAKLLKEMRRRMGKSPTGLNEITVDNDYYEPLPALAEWLQEEAPYFLPEDANVSLAPRGVMMYGPPGTGKTAAAKYIARLLNVPLYHLDPASMLTKYIGESETRLMQSLALVESASPCVLLIDEVEKVFVTNSGDASVLHRMMSQLLWWMQTHRGRVITVMTTNAKEKIPPELYREGRIDIQIEAPMLTGEQANNLYRKVLADLLGVEKLTPGQLNWVTWHDASDQKLEIAPVHVVQMAKKAIKKNGWKSEKSE